MSGPDLILLLKVLVSTVTVLFLAALVMLARGFPKWHGRINTVFFVLTVTTVIGFEVLLRTGTDPTAHFNDSEREWLRIHLWFSIPAALLLPLSMLSGVRKRRGLHIAVGVVFAFLWLGTFVTGVFFLPHRG